MKSKPNTMKTLSKFILSLSIASLPLIAAADPWKEEHGRGKGHGRGHKETYWDGNCKVEVKPDKHGGYKEKRKCKGAPQAYYQPAPVYVAPPPPVYVAPPPPSGVTVQGTIRLP